jgi:ATP-dependent Lhr-like helicase
MAIAMQYPSFPVVMETYRACLKDVFDVPALKEVLSGIERREIRVHDVETPSASPFSRSLVFAYVAAYLYEGDSPAAERRAQALSLDMKLLRELLGDTDLRELLDLAVLEAVEASLQWTTEHRHVRSADALHDLLRSVGDLSEDEIAERTSQDPAPWLEELRVTRRAARSRVAGRPVWIALEDTGLYRDALGTSPPRGVPEAFLASVARPVESLVQRWARTHGPFRTRDVADRFGLETGGVRALLKALCDEGKLLQGEFRPGAEGSEWCDPDVLRQIKRRTLAKLRGQVAPVPRETLARFLPAWHGIGESRRSGDRLEDALIQLEGMPLSYKELERTILPARVPRFRPEQLDELGAMGWLVWVGHSPLRSDDGRVALYRRERVARMLEPPDLQALPEGADERHRAILDHLGRRGASFFTELVAAAELAGSGDGGVPTERTDAAALMEALWDLVWAGLVTNDTFQALRGLAARRHIRRRRGRSRSTYPGGRWALVTDLVPSPASPTERAHALATSFLERHGVLTRESVAVEGLSGGFAGIYRVLRTMEEAGKVRRGYFVEGLGGAQFAYPGTVDRLRRIRDGASEGVVHVLSATDPANPYGWLLSWPEYEDEGGRGPRRVAGATVVLVDGAPVLYLDRGARRLRIMRDAGDKALDQALEALPDLARTRPRRRILLERVNGETATASEFAGRLEGVGFVPEYKAMRLHVP